MTDQPKTIAEQLDAAKNGEEFGAALNRFLTSLGKEPDYSECHDYCWDGDDE